MNIEVLHEKALALSKTYRESESALLDVLMELLKDNGFFRLGYPNLFVYCTSALSLSEAQACYFSKVAKKSEEVPELKMAIEQGVISLSQARRSCRSLRRKRQARGLRRQLSFLNAN